MAINFDDEMKKYNDRITTTTNTKSTEDVVDVTPLPTSGDSEFSPVVYTNESIIDGDYEKSTDDTIDETPLPTTLQTGDDEYTTTKPLGILERSVAPTEENSVTTRDLKTNVQDADVNIKSINDEIGAANVLSLTEYETKVSELKEILRTDDLISNSNIMTDPTISSEETEEETVEEEAARLAEEALAEYEIQLKERAEAILDTLTPNSNTLANQRIQSEMKLEVGEEKSDSIGNYSVIEYDSHENKGSNVSRLNLVGETTPAIDEVIENSSITTAGVDANTDGEINTDAIDLNRINSEESTDNIDVRDNVRTEGTELTNNINIKSVTDTIDETPLPTTFQTDGDGYVTTENSGAVGSRRALRGEDPVVDAIPENDSTSEIEYKAAYVSKSGETNTDSTDDRTNNVIDTPKELRTKSAFENKINYDNQDGIFQPVGSDEDMYDAMTDIASRSVGFIGAELPKAMFNKDSVNLDGFSRFENSITNDGMRFFLFDNIPYQVGKAANAIGSAVKMITDEENRSAKNGTIPNPNVAISATRSAMSLLSYLSYFKWDELLWSLAITNTTLSGGGFIGSPLKGMTVKKYKTNILKGTSVEDFDGDIDVDFNDTPGATVDWLKKAVSKADDVVDFFTKDGKETVNPQEQMSDIKKLVDKTPKQLETEINNQLFHSRYGNGITGLGKDPLQEDRTLKEMDKSNALRIDYHAQVESILNKSLYDGTSYENAKEDGTSLRETIENKGEDKIYNDGKEKSIETNITIEETSFLETYGFRSKPTKIKSEENNITLEDISVLATTFKGNKLNTGSVYVYPLAGESSTISNFKIPFQFTPVITESGQAAKYESASMLHRTGSISSYVNTEGESLTLETNYMMLDDGNEVKVVNGNPTNPWNTFWTPKTVPAIERMFRSLVLPFSGDTKRAFSKPPVVKIVFDKDISEENNKIYSMLKYPIGDSGKYYHRTYVVTKVTIFKDLKESPLLMNEDGTIRDTHGFKLNMELMEIDYNYINSLPEFGEYYNSYSSSLTGNELFKI